MVRVPCSEKGEMIPASLFLPEEDSRPLSFVICSSEFNGSFGSFGGLTVKLWRFTTFAVCANFKNGCFNISSIEILSFGGTLSILEIKSLLWAFK